MVELHARDMNIRVKNRVKNVKRHESKTKVKDGQGEAHKRSFFGWRAKNDEWNTSRKNDENFKQQIRKERQIHQPKLEEDTRDFSFLTDGWDGPAVGEPITTESRLARTDGRVIDHSAV